MSVFPIFLNFLFLVSILSILAILPVSANQDVFEWFRCDACRATFFQIGERVRGEKRRGLKQYEFIELLEDVCENSFTKKAYGVKQYEEKSYLFGPGIVDHLGPDKGFGQMGMGDYDIRLQSYCRMFVEEVGEEKLMELNKNIDKDELCREECRFSASGTSGTPSRATPSGAGNRPSSNQKSSQKSTEKTSEKTSQGADNDGEKAGKKEVLGKEGKTGSANTAANKVQSPEDRKTNRAGHSGLSGSSMVSLDKTAAETVAGVANAVTSEISSKKASKQALKQVMGLLDSLGKNELKEVGDAILFKLWEKIT